MEPREMYKQKYQAQLHEWSAKVDAIKARAEQLTAQARLDARPHVERAHDTFDAASKTLHELTVATDERWDEVRHRAEHAWGELKAAVEGAYDAIRSPPDAR